MGQIGGGFRDGERRERLRVRMQSREWVLMVLAGTVGVSLLGSLAVARLGAGLPVIVSCGYVAAVTVPLCAADLRERRLPNALVLPGFAFAMTGAVSGGSDRGSPPYASVGLCLVALLVFGALAVAGGLGMGDVKLAGMLALALSASGLGPTALLVAVGTAFAGAGVAALVEMLHGEREVPFGPFLLAGFWTAVSAH